MKIINYCKKCGSRKMYLKEKDPHIGLYCTECNKWLAWVNERDLEFYLDNKDVEVMLSSELINQKRYNNPDYTKTAMGKVIDIGRFIS